MKSFPKLAVLALILSIASLFGGCSSSKDEGRSMDQDSTTTTTPPFTQEELETMEPLDYYLRSGYERPLATCIADILDGNEIQSMAEFEDLDPDDSAAQMIQAAVDNCIEIANP